MPRVPTISPATGNPTPEYFIHTTSSNFVDVHGRTLLLRGVNLSGACKTPVGSQSQILENFWEDAEQGDKNFVGRPLNLDDGSADVHLARLKGWGFNMLRYVVTWESLEHEGPGKYDYEFMEYTVRILQKCKEYGFKVFMDPHQDIWSRFSGGSGAPYWTLLACGINPRNMTATQAAILHCEYPMAHDPDPASIPAMLWSTNYGRLAAQTLFTLFFAGRDYAPKCIIDGVNIQDYLEQHYLTAFGLLADRIRDAGDLMDSCVLGWDSMNEPFEGFCGNADLANTDTSHNASLKKGSHPTIIQSLRLGMGQKQTVENWKFTALGPQRDGDVTIDPKGRKLWLDADAEPNGINPRWGWKRDPGWKLGTCIWAWHDLWDVNTGEFINPYYFANLPSDPDRLAEFIPDYWLPHWRLFSKRIRESHPEAIHFIQPPVFVQPPAIDEEYLRGRACYSGHYYDGLTLVTRHWNWFNADALGLLRGKYRFMFQAVKIGEGNIRKSFQEQLAMLKEDTTILGPYPTLIGEIGTPFDMDGKRSYGYTDDGKYAGDYTNQTKALDASLNAADGYNCINWTVWTYVPDNTHKWGDGWYMEDLSIFSPDDLKVQTRSPSIGESKAYSSSATLLSHEPSRNGLPEVKVAIGSASSLSLATIGMELPIINRPGDKIRLPPITSVSTWDNPRDFLLDGGRAVHAFSRPYPTATVGVPIDMQFDINKARFSLTVRVSAEDQPGGREGSARSGTREAAFPTEIFLPLIHFAAPDLVKQSRTRHGSDCDDDSVPSSPIDGSVSSASNFVMSPSVDVYVEASAGRIEIVGQVLRWWYDVPVEGEEALEYKITITRSDGPIKMTFASQKESCFSRFSRVCPIPFCDSCRIH